MNTIFKIRKKNIQEQFLILVLFITGPVVFSQNSNLSTSLSSISIESIDNPVDAAPVVRESSEMNSNMNFVLWFMGTKEDVNSTKSKESFYTKKSVLTSGREPNHLLMKTLLKKAINIESC